MKRISLAAIAALSLCWALWANDGTTPAPTAAVPGRFQIVLGYSTTPEVNGDTEHRRMFRIDTATGETWFINAFPIQVGTGSNTRTCTFDVWQRVQEPGSDLHNAAMKALTAK